MGYDFTLAKLGPKAGFTFPCGFDEAPEEPAAIPWAELRAKLLSIGASENGGPNSLAFETSDGGMIDCFGSDRTIALDVHADLHDVLALYLCLLEVCSDLVVLDDQEGLFHDEASFRKSIADSVGS